MTSVKQFRIDREPTADALGAGPFVLTAATWWFYWGPLPAAIPRKGRSLGTRGGLNS
jgi:phosphoribosylaminoimidazole-succinocarboxamide synthase